MKTVVGTPVYVAPEVL